MTFYVYVNITIIEMYASSKMHRSMSLHKYIVVRRKKRKKRSGPLKEIEKMIWLNVRSQYIYKKCSNSNQLALGYELLFSRVIGVYKNLKKKTHGICMTVLNQYPKVSTSGNTVTVLQRIRPLFSVYRPICKNNGILLSL